MKRFLIPLLLLLAGCSANDVQLIENIPQNTESIKQQRSIEEAENIAWDYYDFFNSNSRAQRATLKPIVIRDLSSRSTDTDTLLYIFNYPENNGYSIISAATEGSPLLAYIEDGSFDTSTANPGGFMYFMDAAKNYVKSKITIVSPGTGFVRTKTEKEYRPKIKVGPLVSLRWGETDYEGAYCPNNKAGLFFVTIAQALSYYNKPSHCFFSNSKNPQYKEINWDDIRKHDVKYHKQGYTDAGLTTILNCPASDDAHNAIGEILYDLRRLYTEMGYMNLDYPSLNFIPDIFDYYNGSESHYNHTLNSYDKYLETFSRIIYNTLTKPGLCIMKRDVINLPDIDEQQTWLIDGYMQADIYKNIYHLDTSSGKFNDWVLQESYKESEDTLYHCNWGFYGKCNGFFTKIAVNPTEGILYDYDIDNSPAGFTEDDNFLSFRMITISK